MLPKWLPVSGHSIPPVDWPRRSLPNIRTRALQGDEQSNAARAAGLD
jgi:hypothetical protein